MRNVFLAILISTVAGLNPAFPLPHSSFILPPSSFLLPPCLASPAPLRLDDSPQPLKPLQGRTEADRDRVEAIALFAAGRAHEDREEYAEALRCYQRALRCDPQSAAAAQGACVTATRLKRYAEAARYALPAVKLGGLDREVLLLAVIDLAEQNEPAPALAFYQQAAAAGRPKPKGAEVLLWMDAGQIYFIEEKPKEAAECFAAVLRALDQPGESGLDDEMKKDILGEPGLTYQMMGECFLAAGRLDEARTAFQKAEQAAPNKALRQFNLARLDAKAGKPAEALKELEAALAGHLADRGTAPYETLADVLAKLGKKNDLIGRLEKLRAANPKDLPLGYFLAQQYRAAGKLDKAESLYRELVRAPASPDNQPNAAGYHELADIYRRGKRFDALLGILGESVEKVGVLETADNEIEPLAAQPEVVRELLAAGRRQAMKSSRKISLGASLATALVALEAKQYDTAGEFFRLALAAKPKQADEVFMIWGVGLLTGDRPAEAAKVFQRAIDEKVLPADNPTFYFYLAGALALDGRTEAALAPARVAAEKKKDVARFFARPAWVLSLGKRYAEADKAYRAVLDRFDGDHANAENRDAMREARLALSNIAVARGDLPQAEEWLEQVLDEFPDDDGAMNDLGYLWADQNKHLVRAERMIRQAVAAEPDNPAYRDSLGWLLYRLGRYPQALAELEKAADADKPDATVLEHLGDAYAKLNRRDKAAAAWRKSAEVFRQEKELDKAKAVEKKIAN